MSLDDKRKRGRPIGSIVQRAREALARNTESYVRLHKQAAEVAAQRGNSQPTQWALEHITALDEHGKEVRPIGSGIDRQQLDVGKSGLTVNIGWCGAPGALQADNGPIIDVSPVEPKQITPGESEDNET